MREKTDRRKFLEKMGRGLIGIVGAGTVGRGIDRDHNEYLGFSSRPVDQIFRDYNGFRLNYTGDEDVVRENKYFTTFLSSGYKEEVSIENIPEEIRKKFKYSLPISNANLDNRSFFLIIKDLKEGERGFANSLRFDIVRKFISNFECTYTEVHLPRNSLISPGNEVFGGKSKIEAELHEVK